MSDTIDALDAWWPPTFTPDGLGRTRLAWWTIAAASHSTRRWIDSSVSRSVAPVSSAVSATAAASHFSDRKCDDPGDAAAVANTLWALAPRRPRHPHGPGARRAGG